jgi:hypothetical protein
MLSTCMREPGVGTGQGAVARTKKRGVRDEEDDCDFNEHLAPAHGFRQLAGGGSQDRCFLLGARRKNSSVCMVFFLQGALYASPLPLDLTLQFFFARQELQILRSEDLAPLAEDGIFRHGLALVRA